MKRKLISVSLALALGLSLAACGSKPAPSGAETPAGELGTLSGPVELQFWHSISNQNHLKVLEGWWRSSMKRSEREGYYRGPNL